MIISTTENVPGKTVKEVLGIVRGNTVRVKWFGKDFVASLRSIVGGEVSEYTEMMTEAREQAFQRMIEKAEKLDADAIICVRFMTAEVMRGAAEMLCYGTAVKLK
ncbi:MAG: YbjQ family protein [archaeon]